MYDSPPVTRRGWTCAALLQFALCAAWLAFVLAFFLGPFFSPDAPRWGWEHVWCWPGPTVPLAAWWAWRLRRQARAPLPPPAVVRDPSVILPPPAAVTPLPGFRWQSDDDAAGDSL